jgi:hypothetical protein
MKVGDFVRVDGVYCRETDQFLHEGILLEGPRVVNNMGYIVHYLRILTPSGDVEMYLNDLDMIDGETLVVINEEW